MPVLIESPHILPNGRDAAMNKRKSKKQEVLDLMNGGLNIVATIPMPNGNVVYVADNFYANKTPEELEAIKKNFYNVCWRVIQNNAERNE